VGRYIHTNHAVTGSGLYRGRRVGLAFGWPIASDATSK